MRRLSLSLSFVFLASFVVLACSSDDPPASPNPAPDGGGGPAPTSCENQQCDDGALVSLDGCDATCRFEQMHRAVALQLQFATTEYCAANALGASISALAQGQIQQGITTSVKDGSLTALLELKGDPTGASGDVSATTFSGTPVVADGYDGTNDLDWWYAPDLSTREPPAIMTGSFTGGNVALAGVANLKMTIGGSPALLRIVDGKLRAKVGEATAPTRSATGTTPGHPTTLKLQDTFKSYATLGGTPAEATGEICGSVTARSLSNAGMPVSLRPGGQTACVEAYGEVNKIIDLFVNGCKAKLSSFDIPVVNPTQPDTADKGKPALGAGAPYKLSVDPATKRVNACADKAGAPVDLEACLDTAAYSAYFVLATDRVIVRTPQ